MSVQLAPTFRLLRMGQVVRTALGKGRVVRLGKVYVYVDVKGTIVRLHPGF